MSQLTVVFDDDVDVYFARQLVLERVMAVRERLLQASSRCWRR
ncbi:MAG: hypothetical protein R3B08_02145 [Nitrospira sp.]